VEGCSQAPRPSDAPGSTPPAAPRRGVTGSGHRVLQNLNSEKKYGEKPRSSERVNAGSRVKSAAARFGCQGWHCLARGHRHPAVPGRRGPDELRCCWGELSPFLLFSGQTPEIPGAPFEGSGGREEARVSGKDENPGVQGRCLA